MKKNLVFIGNYGNRNVGDDAILHVLSSRYKKHYPEYNQYVFARYYPEDIRTISHAQPLTMEIASIWFVLLHCQLVVIGGGGIFSAYTGPVAKLIPFFALLCKALFKKVVYESIGFYSTAGTLEKYAVLFSMLFADRVTVRDKASIQTVQPILSVKKVELVNDPGLEIKPVSTAKALKLLEKEDIRLPKTKKIIGVSIKRLKNPALNARYLKAVITFLNKLLKSQKYSVIFIPFCHDKEKHTEKDLEFALEAVDQLSTTKDVYVLKKYYTPAEVAGIITLCDAFIGTRFHSIVFGHALKVSLIPISYEEKCSDFIVKHGYTLLEAATLTSQQLENYLDTLLKRKK